MSNSSTLEEINFIPAGDAAKQFGYTKEYLLMLAKDGKISGKKEGHKWFVDTASVENFFKGAEIERNVRRKKISEERKKEFERHVKSSYDLVSTAPLRQKRKSTASLEFVSVMLVGLTVGLLGYLGTNTPTSSTYADVQAKNLGFVDQLAFSLSSFFGSRTADSVPVQNVTSENSTDTAVSQNTIQNNGSEIIPEESRSSALIVAKESELNSESAAEIAASFSDEVRVEADPQNPGTGIVIPQFKSSDGEAYRFLLVPIQTEEDVTAVNQNDTSPESNAETSS